MADKEVPIKGELPTTRATPVLAPAINPAMVPEAVPVPTADGTQEYVAGGNFGTVYPNTYHALAPSSDDATYEFGLKLYEVMLRDSTVGGSFELLKQGVLEGEIRLLPAVMPKEGTLPGEDDNPDIPLAQEICDFCSWALKRLPRPLEDCLYELLDGMAFGNKLAEMVFGVQAFGPHKGKTTVERIDVKPSWAWAFVVDPYSSVLGILGAVPGQIAMPGGIVGAQGQVSGNGVFLPRDKFCIFTWMARDGDPRGSSILRRAVNGWNQKVGTIAGLGKFLKRFAEPAISANVPDNAKDQAPTDSAGNRIAGAKQIPATQYLYNQLINFQGGSVIVGPAGTELKILEPTSDGAVYREAIALFKREIVFAILQTTRGVLEAEHGSKADSEVGQDDKGVLVKYAKGVLARMIQREILRVLVRLNWGDELAERLLPVVTVGGVEGHDFAKDATAVAGLKKSGYLAQSQLRAVDARLGLPIRTEEPDDVSGDEDLIAAENEQVDDDQTEDDTEVTSPAKAKPVKSGKGSLEPLPESK